MQISVLGAGAWGTALAIQAARAGHAVCLWGRDAAAMDAMRAGRRNSAYLPDSELPAALALTADRGLAVAHAGEGLTIVATPMSGLRETLAALPSTQRVLWLCKGFEAGTGRLGHEIARELQPSMPVGVLSGPSFAQEVAAGRPTALVAASEDAALARAAVDAFHGERLRVYTSSDPVGVEVGGAVKNRDGDCGRRLRWPECRGAGRARPERACGVDHARPGGDAATGFGPGRQGRDLHGSVGLG